MADYSDLDKNGGSYDSGRIRHESLKIFGFPFGVDPIESEPQTPAASTRTETLNIPGHAV